MSIITKEMLQNLVEGSPITGTILLQGFSVQLTKTGKEYVIGTLTSGESISFKAWSSSNAFDIIKSASNISGKAVSITGTVETYNGVQSIILSNVTVVEDADLSVFLEEKYDANAYWISLRNLVFNYISDTGKELANKTLFENEAVSDRFKIEFAAHSHHDAVKSGLLAHTYKVVQNTINILLTYPNLAKTQDEKDLIILGALLHDIGKTIEYNLGNPQPLSFLTHRIVGIEMLDKTLISSLYSEMWYYQLVAILVQHHGEYDDNCRTVASYIVHKADVMDSLFTDLNTALEKPIRGNTGDYVKAESYKLSLYKE